MQFNRTDVHRQMYSGIRSSSTLLVSECDNSLFFTGKKGVFTSESERVSNSLYFLLIVYVHCFCVPVPLLVLNILSRYEKNDRSVCDENMHIYCSENISYMVNDDYLSILSFLLKEQIKFNLIHRNQY
jgi:hypothetical protein